MNWIATAGSIAIGFLVWLFLKWMTRCSEHDWKMLKVDSDDRTKTLGYAKWCAKCHRIEREAGILSEIDS